MDTTRPLSPDEQRVVRAARAKAFLLYEGVRTPHRSCGIALAETFGLPTRSYQALRKGGLSGLGPCGAVVAGRLVLGEILGDPDPTGATTERLRAAIAFYDASVPSRVDRGAASGSDWVCNTLTAPFPEFGSPARASFCTRLATEVATLVAEALIRVGEPVAITALADVPEFDPARPVDPLPR